MVARWQVGRSVSQSVVRCVGRSAILGRFAARHHRVADKRSQHGTIALPPVRQLMSVGRSRGGMVSRLVGRSVARSVGRLVGRSVARSVGRSVARWDGRSVGRLVGGSMSVRWEG